jgi:hypothetical protein
VYLGGDETPGGKGEGPIYRCNSTLTPGTQCTRIVADAGTANNTAPHPDSRRMRFDAQGRLIETDDGGIFRRTKPRTADGDWTSINGNLAITVPHSCAYDHIACDPVRTQEIGAVQQPATGGRGTSSHRSMADSWLSLKAPDSTRYYSSKAGAIQPCVAMRQTTAASFIQPEHHGENVRSTTWSIRAWCHTPRPAMSWTRIDGDRGRLCLRID